jgi:hypothetical protein
MWAAHNTRRDVGLSRDAPELGTDDEAIRERVAGERGKAVADAMATRIAA